MQGYYTTALQELEIPPRQAIEKFRQQSYKLSHPGLALGVLINIRVTTSDERKSYKQGSRFQVPANWFAMQLHCHVLLSVLEIQFFFMILYIR